MIPKIIHYVWIGPNLKTEKTLKCIESWKTFLPDYEIKEWNESNFDIEKIPFAAQAYNAKKWAYVSDVIRVYALATEGGLYFDTDLEILQKPQDIFECGFVTGFENNWLMEAHVLASEKGHIVAKSLLEHYLHAQFDPNEMVTVTTLLTEVIMQQVGKKVLKNSTYHFSNLHIFDKKYFSPDSIVSESIAFHHFEGSWKNRVSFTHIQWTMHRIRIRLLHIMFPFFGNVKTVRRDNLIWKKAQLKTKINLEKKRKIYIVI